MSGPLHHRRRGPADGAPVLLLHAGVADRRMWEDLASSYDVLSLDLRGFGVSGSRPDGPWSHVQDVAATLDALEVRAARVVGCSLGAGVAAELAATRTDLVASLLLVSPGGPLITELTDQLRAFGRAEGQALAAGDVDTAVAANVSTWVDGPRRSGEPGLESVREAVRTMQRAAFELQLSWPDEVVEDEQELDPPLDERLGDLAVPTTVLVGELDVDAVLLAADRVASAVPGATLVRWPDAAHLPSLEHPGRFAELVRSWLA
jgi:3-oxoadipate enol-lactonase